MSCIGNEGLFIVLLSSCSAESANDFIHKLKIVLKELNETKVWLQIIMQSQMIPKQECASLYKECNELCRIISASVKTPFLSSMSQAGCFSILFDCNCIVFIVIGHTCTAKSMYFTHIGIEGDTGFILTINLADC